MSFILDQEKTWFQRDFGLDVRLIKALSKLGFTYPTIVQSKAIPIALQGMDVLVKARTGSGKTAAFLLPTLHKILIGKDMEKSSNAQIRAIIFAPTKELCKQIERHAIDLTYYCKDVISLCSFSDDNNTVQQYKLVSKPDVVITTPTRLAYHIKSGAVPIDLSHVTTLVIDEADLVLSFGYSEDVQLVTTKMPKIFQGLLMSATLSPELDKFKRLVLHNPAIIKLQESKGAGNLLQFYIETTELDKFLILYVFIKLGLLQGKGLVFVNDIDKCYKLKLFLQQFFISAAVLNDELPLNSRLHILEEFNRGVFEFLIATDACIDDGEDDEEEEEEGGDDREDTADDGEDRGGDGEDESGEGEGDFEEDEENDSLPNKKSTLDAREQIPEDHTRVNAQESRKQRPRSQQQDKEYGVSRGIDFQNVSFVVNFDFPRTSAAYTHRIGRTARAGAHGTALSFVVDHERADGSNDKELLQLIQSQQTPLDPSQNDNILAALAPIHPDSAECSSVTPGSLQPTILQPSPLLFNMKELDSFRYRVEDTLRSVTAVVVKEYRSAEIKQEILNSRQLKVYFAENPNDLKILRHDKSLLHPIRTKDHLKHVPEYLIPSSMRSVASTNSMSTRKKRKRKVGQSQENGRKMSKARDPLHSFEAAEVDNEQEAGVEDFAGQERVQRSIATEKSAGGFTKSDSSGSSTAGRQQWKIRHQKGKFNKKASKKSSLRTPGSFANVKSKKFLK